MRGQLGRSVVERVRGFLAEVPLREKRIVLGAAILSAVLVLIYIAISPTHVLSGDEPVYDEYGRNFAAGQFWEQSLPHGDQHPSAWKAPVYPAWVGIWYSLLGSGDWPGSVTAWERVEVIQGLLLAPLTVLLTWLLARRLLGVRVAIAAAVLTAVFPLSWEYFGLLFPEALAIPLTLGFLLVVLDREPTQKRALAAGALLGLGLLVHPTSFVLAGALVAAWWLAAGMRRGLAMSALAGLIALLVVAPWTIRNMVEFDGALIPVSIQDAAIYGTFNDEAVNDPIQPYAWRPTPDSAREELAAMEREQVDEAEFHDRLRDLGTDYILDNPQTVPVAIVRNGILRFWDLRPPSQAIDEVTTQGRSAKVRGIGLLMYYPLLIGALIGTWRLRRRREIVLPVLAAVGLVAIVFMVIGATRYRAPLEPLLVILACSLLAGPQWLNRHERVPA